MIKFWVSLAAWSLITSQQLMAQFYFYNDKYFDRPVVYEIGIKSGIMNSLTDVGGKKGPGKNFIKDLNWKFAKPVNGIYIMVTYNNAIGLRLEASFGEVMGYDSILKDVKATTYGRYERNLSFKSSISDFQLAAEIHPLYFKVENDRDLPRISPYAVIGIGYYSFDPQAKLKGEWYSLQPLRTEGQGFAEYPDHKPYKLNQINFAAGAGLCYEISALFNARFEINHRMLQTDYLDDVSTTYIDPDLFFNYLPVNSASIAKQLANRKDELGTVNITNVGDQRGDPKDNDAFFTIQFKLGVMLGRQKR